MKSLLFPLLLLFLVSPLAAQEGILSCDSEVEVLSDGTLDVTEHIVVNALGDQIHRGIQRDFSRSYRDNYGNRVKIEHEVTEVRRNDKLEPWVIENGFDYIRLNIGSDELLPTPAEYTYTLHYRTTRRLVFFSDHDQLRWNAIENDWIFPVEKGSVRVRLPQPVPAAQMQLESAADRRESQDSAYTAQIIGPGVAYWRLTRALAPKEELTIGLRFPKEVVAAPTQRWLSQLQDNLDQVILWIGLIMLVGYGFIRWHRVGRQPKFSVHTVRYEPPSDYSPGGLRFLRKRKYDARCFSSELLALAVAGKLCIHHDKRLLKKEWRLVKMADSDATMTAAAEQQMLFSAVFAENAEQVTLQKASVPLLSRARDVYQKALNKRFVPVLLDTHNASVAIALTIVLLSITASLVVAMLLNGGGLVDSYLSWMIGMLLGVWFFSYVMKVPTAAGRALRSEIEEFRRYLSVSERDEQKLPPGTGTRPPLDGRRYALLLPYAVALDVEDAWTRKFIAVAGPAMAMVTARKISWYQSDGINDLSRLIKEIGNDLESRIAACAPPAGRSSSRGGRGDSRR